MSSLKKPLGNGSVLIDTWWNVNVVLIGTVVFPVCFNRYMVECEFYYLCKKFHKFYVLIDTWWNVNNDPLSKVSLDISF